MCLSLEQCWTYSPVGSLYSIITICNNYKASGDVEGELWMKNLLEVFVGRGGALVESMPFDRRVAGSNPALAAT